MKSTDKKLDEINSRLKRVETNSHIHLVIILLGFLGVLSLRELVRKVK